MHQKELAVAKETAVEAGKEIMKFYKGSFSIEEKNEYNYSSPLTSADTAANKIIVDKLSSEFGYPILSEESKDDLSRLQKTFVWIVDPLDGTRSFVSEEGQFTVNIALVKDNKPVLGVIYVPVTEQLFSSSEGNGSFLSVDGQVTRLLTSSIKEISEMTLVAGKHYVLDALKQISTQFRRQVSMASSLKGCLVAQSKADVYIRFGPTSEWDICAMYSIVKEAGATITFIDNEEILFNRENIRNKGFVVSNGVAHNKILSLVAPLIEKNQDLNLKN